LIERCFLRHLTVRPVYVAEDNGSTLGKNPRRAGDTSGKCPAQTMGQEYPQAF